LNKISGRLHLPENAAQRSFWVLYSGLCRSLRTFSADANGFEDQLRFEIPLEDFIAFTAAFPLML
jgi:hypothetical protein